MAKRYPVDRRSSLSMCTIGRSHWVDFCSPMEPLRRRKCEGWAERGVAASGSRLQPLRPFQEEVDAPHQGSDQPYDEGISPRLVELRHMREVHAVPAGNQRGRG